MKQTTSEQLAVFGKNRYHDWVVFFSITVLLVAIGIACNVWLYMNTKALVYGLSDAPQAPSKYEAFIKDVEFLSSYIDGRRNTQSITVPRDPSLR